MIRQCEIKLIDVLKEGNFDMAKTKGKTLSATRTFLTESRCTRTSLGSMSPHKKKYSCHTTSGLVDTKAIKKGICKDSKLAHDRENISYGSTKLRTVNIISAKRKRCNGDVNELSPKKRCNTVSDVTEFPKKPDKKIIMTRKRKKKSRESCWENKLTGARRVSKRLSNLRIIEKQKSLKDLGLSSNETQAAIKTSQQINFSARRKMKINEEIHVKPPKKSKTSYFGSGQEAQINFGKLSQTKRMYPKISAKRRQNTYTVTMKSSAHQHNPRKNKKKQENIAYNRFNEVLHDSDVNLLIKKCVEDAQNCIVSEHETPDVSESAIREEKGTLKPDDELESKETVLEEHLETSSKDTGLETFDETSDEELTDGSTTAFINIEPVIVNIEYEIPKESTSNKHTLQPENENEERKTDEIITDVDETSGTECEDVTIKQDNSEEENKDNPSNENTNLIDLDKVSGITNSTIDTRGSSLMSETIDITDSAD